MGATSTASGGGNFEQPEVGSFAARCYGVVEIGTHEEEYKGEKKLQKKMIVFWELDQKMEDGRPFVINKWYTNSLGEKANLRKDLKTWRGRDFTEAELAKFEMKKILNQPCLISLSEKKERVQVAGIIPLPKGMQAPPLENDTIDWGICDLGDEEAWDKLYDWVKKFIMKSVEYKEWEAAGNSMPESGSQEEEAFDPDDEIPF